MTSGTYTKGCASSWLRDDVLWGNAKRQINREIELMRGPYGLKPVVVSMRHNC